MEGWIGLESQLNRGSTFSFCIRLDDWEQKEDFDAHLLTLPDTNYN